MSEYMICNAISLYNEAPVSLDILKEKTALVLEGIKAKQAEKNYIMIEKDKKELIFYLEEAVKNEFDFTMDIIAVTPARRFVYGNATAAIKVIEGEKPIPTGMDESLPVYSVEMLLESNVKEVYIGENAKKTGRYSLSKKIKPQDILKQCGSKNDFKAMYFGYPMGLLVGEDQLDTEVELTTDYICIFDDSDCILDRLLKIIQGYTIETCGRCIFGYEGVTQIQMILSDMVQKKGKSEDINLLLDLCGEMQGQVLCDIGEVAAKTVINAVGNFRNEIEGHITKKACAATVCSKFVTYHILEDLCIGCNECQDACEEDAISGKKRFVHIIDQDECIQCGACLKACEQEAIVKAGAVKPRGPKRPVPCKAK